MVVDLKELETEIRVRLKQVEERLVFLRQELKQTHTETRSAETTGFNKSENLPDYGRFLLRTSRRISKPHRASRARLAQVLAHGAKNRAYCVWCYSGTLAITVRGTVLIFGLFLLDDTKASTSQTRRAPNKC
jgi:hypothetical protein